MKRIICAASFCMIAGLSYAESNVTNILNRTIFSPEKGVCTILSVEEWNHSFVDVKLNETVYTARHQSSSSQDIFKIKTVEELGKAGDVITIQPKITSEEVNSHRIPVNVITFDSLRPSTLKRSPRPGMGYSFSADQYPVTSLGDNQDSGIVYFVSKSPAEAQYRDINNVVRRLNREINDLLDQRYRYASATNTAHALYALAKENRNALLAQQAKLTQLSKHPRFSSRLEEAALALQDANKANIEAVNSFATDFETEQILNTQNLQLVEKRLAAQTAWRDRLQETAEKKQHRASVGFALVTEEDPELKRLLTAIEKEMRDLTVHILD